MTRTLLGMVNRLIAAAGARLVRAATDESLRQKVRDWELMFMKNHENLVSNLSSDVSAALKLSEIELQAPEPKNYLLDVEAAITAVSPKDLFSHEGTQLPCWQESDVGLYDDWLTNPRNYPIYHALFKELSAISRTRLLELGVRTGNMGVVFARASVGPVSYLGVDPNEYVSNGLDLAAKSFRTLRETLPAFDFFLLEGVSTDSAVQRSLLHSAPFDLIHIDGDHTLTGKLIDLDLARRLVAPKGYILVDDYDHHPPISEAIRRAWTLGWFKEFYYIPTMRGLALLR